MRIRIDHATTYTYAAPARFIVQLLRLTPRSNEGQQVRAWGLETDVDARLRRAEDAFGNVVHALYTERPTGTLTVRVSGEVHTTDTAGMLKGVTERLSPLVFLRSTSRTAPEAALVDFAETARGSGSRLDQLHALMAALHGRMSFKVGATDAGHTAAEAFALGSGVCQDYAQIFIACARRLGIPARYVSGHLLREDGQESQEAAHAWAEAFVDGLGWVGFDISNGISPDPHYVRVATGRDYRDAAPITGIRYGARDETMHVKLAVAQQRVEQ